MTSELLVKIWKIDSYDGTSSTASVCAAFVERDVEKRMFNVRLVISAQDGICGD